MKILVSLAAVGVLFLLGLLGGAGGVGGAIFGVLIPYLALAIFLGGLVYRVFGWAKVPVPFRIPTTCGQEKSLALDQTGEARQPQRPPRRRGTDGVGSACLPLAVAQYQVGTARGATDLRHQPRTLGGGHGLPLVDAGHSHPAPAAGAGPRARAGDVGGKAGRFPRSGSAGVLRDHDGISGGPGIPAFQAAGGAAGPLYLAVGRLLLAAVAVGDRPERVLAAAHVPRPTWWASRSWWWAWPVSTSCFRHRSSPLFFGHLFLVSVLLAYFPFSKLVHMPGVF